MRNILSYSVAPRYTAGSPAGVDSTTAERVVEQERQAYGRHVGGFYGDEGKAKAEREGLEGIVYATAERRGTIFLHDLITNAYFAIPVKYWGANAPDGQHYWYSRTDREQFRVIDMTGRTEYQRRGKLYRYAVLTPTRG